jgi:flavin-dependent dehydrogenase
VRVDVLIIGGSLAGASCVRELARQGVDAIAVDRDTFPRGKVCGGFLSPNAVDLLDRMDLLPRVHAAGAVGVDHARINVFGAPILVSFRRKGLGISRRALDAGGANIRQGIAVREVRSVGDGFEVRTADGTIRTKIVVDAAGKLSRFTRHVRSPHFGVQYFEAAAPASALNFWFFKDGYGGSVNVEAGQSNSCFLIKKDAIPRYRSMPDCLVTGPLSYEHVRGDYIAIGDAAGMIDPFCGEGMCHALDSGITAARTIERGLSRGQSYAEMRQAYELEWLRRWGAKRLITQVIRSFIDYPRLFRAGSSLNSTWFLDRLWDPLPASP